MQSPSTWIISGGTAGHEGRGIGRNGETGPGTGSRLRFWWSWGDSNPRPRDCQSRALPTAPQPQKAEELKGPRRRAATGSPLSSPLSYQRRSASSSKNSRPLGARYPPESTDRPFDRLTIQLPAAVYSCASRSALCSLRFALRAPCPLLPQSPCLPRSPTPLPNTSPSRLPPHPSRKTERLLYSTALDRSPAMSYEPSAIRELVP